MSEHLTSFTPSDAVFWGNVFPVWAAFIAIIRLRAFEHHCDKTLKKRRFFDFSRKWNGNFKRLKHLHIIRPKKNELFCAFPCCPIAKIMRQNSHFWTGLVLNLICVWDAYLDCEYILSTMKSSSWRWPECNNSYCYRLFTVDQSWLYCKVGFSFYYILKYR